jgi:hypothetical protein
MNRSAIQDILRGLPVEQVSVLYWKCQGLNYEKIGLELHIAPETVSREMAFVYDKLGTIIGIDKNTHWRTRKRVLEEDVCDALMHLIDGNPANLDKFPQRVAEQPLKSEVLALVLFDQMKEDETVTADEEVIYGEPVDDVPPTPHPHQKPPTPLLSGPRVGFPWVFLTGIVIVVMAVMVVMVALLILGIRNAQNEPRSNSQNGLQTQIPEASATSTRNPTATSTETLTPTPVITPTPMPLPIKEDFSEQYSDLWWVIGDPILTESIAGGQFSGVLTNRGGEMSTLLVGNTAWTDYVIYIRANLWTSGYPPPTILIGVRVIDLNNMIALDCYDNMPSCDWVIIYEGVEDRIKVGQQMIMNYGLRIVVQGDTVSALVQNVPSSGEQRMSIILPAKYKDKFQGGGVLLQTTSFIEVDYVEIESLP